MTSVAMAAVPQKQTSSHTHSAMAGTHHVVVHHVTMHNVVVHHVMTHHVVVHHVTTHHSAKPMPKSSHKPH
ncbi:MAG: hypothetical protein ACREMP_07245 [Candidatus Tyrphobacter sp.]